jgi:tetratricopeptide (TPR) repeat protein
LKPDNAHAYFHRGLAKANFGQYQDAIADYDQALQLKHDYAHAYVNRGLAKDNLGQYQGSFADLQAAAALESVKVAGDGASILDTEQLVLQLWH